MMKLRKLLTMALTAAALVGVMVVGVSAEDIEVGDGKTYTTISAAAIEAAGANGTITLTSDIAMDSGDVSDNGGIIELNKSITLDGGNHTITFTDTYTTNRYMFSAINVTGNGTTEATIKNVTLTVADGNDSIKHGINAYVGTDVTVENVTITNFSKGCAVTVNGATVNATGLSTSGSGWGGVNVSKGGGVITDPLFAFDSTSSFAEAAQIYVDHADVMLEWVSAPAGWYVLTGVTGYASNYYWTQTQPAVENKDTGIYYATLAAAVSAAEAGNTIVLHDDIVFDAETENSGVTISKNITLDLNGCTLTNTNTSSQPTDDTDVRNIYVDTDATLTIQDSSAAGTGAIEYTYDSVANTGRGAIDVAGALVVESGTLPRVLVIEEGKATVNGGSVATISNHNIMDGHTVITVNGGYVGSIYSTYMIKAYDHDVVVNGGEVGSITLLSSSWAYNGGEPGANADLSAITPVAIAKLAVASSATVGAIAIETYDSVAALAGYGLTFDALFDFTGCADNTNFTYNSTAYTIKDGAVVLRHTVTFEAGDGTASFERALTDCDGKLTSLPSASQSGYTFLGWFDGDDQITTSYIFAEDTTVDASWEKKSTSSSGTTTTTPSTDVDDDDDEEVVEDEEEIVEDEEVLDEEILDEEIVETVGDFEDVTVDTYYADAVLWAVDNGITNGTNSDGTTFSPEDDCSRAEIVTFLYRAFGEPDADGESLFEDIDSEAYYSDAVAWAADNGVTTGLEDGSFGADLICTRAQIVTFLYRAAGEPEITSDVSFADVDGDSYYAAAVAWAYENGITLGTGDDTFSPDENCTRGQIVTFLYRYMAE